MASVERVASIDDLPAGAMQRVTVQGRDVLLVNVGGEFSAVSADCPHAGAPLEEGDLLEASVVCPWHGSSFAIPGGDLLEGPAIDPLRSYRVIIRGNDVLVDVGTGSAM